MPTSMRAREKNTLSHFILARIVVPAEGPRLSLPRPFSLVDFLLEAQIDAKKAVLTWKVWCSRDP